MMTPRTRVLAALAHQKSCSYAFGAVAMQGAEADFEEEVRLRISQLAAGGGD